MYYPNVNNIPSESTVEQLSNHFILNNLSPKAWIVVPTRKEEKLLGYDAELINNKIAFIQYKRIKLTNSKHVTIELKVDQHKTLVNNFPPKKTPYAFYAFNINNKNIDIEKDFDRATSHLRNDFFNKTIFVDIHDVIPRNKSVFSINYHLISGKFLQSNIINFWNGPQFINEYQNCRVGNLIKEIGESKQISETANFLSLDKLNAVICPEEELQFEYLEGSF